MVSEEDKQIDDVAHKIVAQIGQGIKLELKRQLDLLGKKVSHDAIESIDFYPDTQEVGSELDYLYNLEWGRKAGSHVPLPRLKEWCVHKLGLSENEAWAVVKGVEKKIFEEGIPMTRFMKKGVISYIAKT